MHVVLVNTPFAHAYGEYDPELDPKMPLGLLSLGSSLIEHGHGCRILDANMKRFTAEQVVQDILTHECDLLGLNVLTSSLPAALAIAKLARTKQPTLRIVAGGPHATMSPQDLLGPDSCINACVIGEGEITLLELAKRTDWRDVQGIAYSEEGRVLRTPPRPRISDLDTLPLPRWEMLDTEKYFSAGRLSIMASRGCPMACTYCPSRAMWGSRLTWRSAAGVLREMDVASQTHGVESFHFLDDDLLAWPELEAFCGGLEDRVFSFRCIARAERATAEAVEMIGRAGCTGITFGIETGSPRLQESVHKRVRLSDLPDQVARCHRAGLHTKAYFMLGFPDESLVEMEQTIQLACTLRDVGLEDAMFLPVVPYRGTALFEQSARLIGDVAGLGLVEPNPADPSAIAPVGADRFRKCRYRPVVSASPDFDTEFVSSKVVEAYSRFYAKVGGRG